ncbi:TetR/AcrR family transcriptional regulator [Nocardioides zeae]|uniref:TetR/AcrR family transcriptional regulator n=1 Tax=Nocardioides imazamoxiresistens TaxID=3231893 RepID=A0ABU3PZ23_9ACTN|nr:TetR/AcrR family transcriptional regulator [Nocardioides zeae]MDT9594364.1 TetR/AcrR family transcriptional regulator [Nocardioides zeae]
MPDPRSSTSPASRAAGSVRTRLQRAALDLFDEKGYDGTTVDEIAERAGVGRTTFFRAFRSKEDVIFPHHDELLEQVRTRLATSPATEANGLVAVFEATSLVLRHYVDEGDLAVRRYHLTRTVPSLRDREVAGLRQYQHAFWDHIRTWMPDDLQAKLMAACVTTAHNTVLRQWLRGEVADPWATFNRAMAQVRELFEVRGGADGATVVVLDGAGADPAQVGAAVERALRARA